ncbi:MAG TPA: GDP-mannose 4,6-dehydratase [Roseiflexaceae bacterium]|jgi:CDP-paratose 2-epimerase
MKVLITGGAGFIGCNTAKRFLDRGDEVMVLDNLSRHQAQIANVNWLKALNKNLQFVKGDIRDHGLLRTLFRENDFDAVIHLAAQTAVTTSVVDPRMDFEVNALGSFNLLEAIREEKRDPAIIYASTNKVYGGMEEVGIVERNGRYEYADLPNGVAESRTLDFHSPYGCSKGAADQYMIDYSRIYGLRTVTMRQSCIYGYRQFGMEDQGWIAWFTIAVVTGKPFVIYGDGKQVRDVLFIDDLIDLYELALAKIDTCAGQMFNVGGGPDNCVSLLETIAMLEELVGRRLPYNMAEWRPGDQRVFVCDYSKARAAFGWVPRVGPAVGIKQLYKWIVDNQSLFSNTNGAMHSAALELAESEQR